MKYKTYLINNYKKMGEKKESHYLNKRETFRIKLILLHILINSNFEIFERFDLWIFQKLNTLTKVGIIL